MERIRTVVFWVFCHCVVKTATTVAKTKYAGQRVEWTPPVIWTKKFSWMMPRTIKGKELKGPEDIYEEYAAARAMII